MRSLWSWEAIIAEQNSLIDAFKSQRMEEIFIFTFDRNWLVTAFHPCKRSLSQTSKVQPLIFVQFKSFLI